MRSFGDDLVDHRTYVIAGDGCLMEGISHEAIALAGHLKLNKLIVLWDDNQHHHRRPDLAVGRPTISSRASAPAAGTSSASTATIPPPSPPRWPRRRAAISPALIACRTIIGYGAPNKAGTAATHGSPLGAEEVAGAREKLGWSHAPFVVPNDDPRCLARLRRNAAPAPMRPGEAVTLQHTRPRRIRPPHRGRPAAQDSRLPSPR